jgi:NAD(P)-dependent dehydrogenase (short-subunit alcohol dehydrogenase family)
MDLGFKDKIALVTGAGSQVGMGKTISLTLAKEGCDIIATDIDLEGAQKTADEVKALGRKAIALKADITNRDEVGEMVKKGLAEFGKIDILINAAGLTAGGGPFLQANTKNWEKDINVNLYGTMYTCQAVLPGMVERKYGKIVNIASIAARLGTNVSYAAAKAGVLSLTRGLATEFGPSGININAIAPGMVPSTMFGGGKVSPEFQQRFIGNVPMRRVNTVEDMANAVAFFASDISMNITGQMLAVDSGRTMA